MILRVFVDSDVILDVAVKRSPFFEASNIVLKIIENNLALGFLSGTCITNIYYVLRKISDSDKAKKFLHEVLNIFSVLSVGQQNIIEALFSDMKDFEDAVQHSCAQNNNCDCIVTRNIDDYRSSKITVYSPEEFIQLFKDKILTTAST